MLGSGTIAVNHSATFFSAGIIRRTPNPGSERGIFEHDRSEGRNLMDQMDRYQSTPRDPADLKLPGGMT